VVVSGVTGVTVLRAGLLTTVQDLGRWGSQALGVPVSGAMDSGAHRLANALVGNPPTAATLEVTLLGPELRADRALVVAVAGAEFALSVNGHPVPHQTAFALKAGATLRFGERRVGSRAYLAVAGGVDTPPVLGSRATHLVSGMGGLDGRALVNGDVLPIGAATPRAIAAIDHRLERIDHEVQILTSLRDAVFLVGPRAQLEDTLLAAVVDPDHDQLDAIARRQRVEALVDAPFAGKGGGVVE